ncbi:MULTISPECIES: DNA topoisomerase [unclassified Fusibacter]|uniref:DNA topoisomerase n=1 Tax=unclassified Fusibacter TaxID=2624464 RepID=UPI001013373A|nr:MULTISPECIES: DNA topoisomerase [unclassified Fusibacter]MCK8060375.1 DNA topoisomerase [Fusibacter sp. A2]NPE20336.1 type IA DNA topoisomerase [Fusibacter sp. A1]RXV63542.1 type IA DNA topoisomerase [Fusibacter sp. A1]
MSKVIIAEKPSVAKNIAEAIGAKNRRDGYYESDKAYVTWAFGHLLELFDAKDYDEKMAGWRLENFPFVPHPFQYKIKGDSKNRHVVDEGAKKQLDTIRRLIEDDKVTGVISACDFDREGQIIGDIILDYLQVKKPVKRLLLNEWTPTEVKEGLTKMVDNETMRPLKDAGISRQWADWMIGINLTSVATLKYQRGSGKALNVGRVLLPTLKIIYDRDIEIENFVKEEFHKLIATVKTEKGELFESVFTFDNKDKFEEKPFLEDLKKAILKQPAFIEELTKETKREYPPVLFNLSGLQGHVTSKQKGWTSDKVLKVAQSLYEKKLITYPRTASLALEESLIEKVKRVLFVHKKGLPFEEEIEFHTQKRVFDNSKVESHSAITPTYIQAKGLSPDEQVVYDAVRNRFLMQFMPIAEHEETVITVKCGALDGGEYESGRFITKGRVQLIEGWRKVEKIKSKEKVLPKVEKDEVVHVEKAKIETKGTNPPKKHTEKTLLRVMETCGKKFKTTQKPKDAENDSDSDEDDDDIEGIDVNEKESEEDLENLKAILSGFSIGTPATRAETISKLIRVGYVAMKGKSLYCTPVGKKMVELFPVKSLFDLEYTGRLEKTLSDIGKGEIPRSDFLNEIESFTADAVHAIKSDQFHVIQDLGNKRADDREVLGKCPTCGSAIVEGEKGYGCTNYKGGCKFIIWKNDKYLTALKVAATKSTIMKLLEKGEVCSNQFINKKGEKFAACLSYQKNEDNDYFSWRMRFPDRNY